MAAFRYPTKRSKEIKFTAKDFSNIRKALGQAIATEECLDGFGAVEKRNVSSYRTTLKKLAHIRKKK